jgi:Cytochrome bd terminal oxidase subunit II
MHTLSTFNDWLPVIFMAVMGLAMLAYVVLDGYDLGVGILLRRASTQDKDVMISSIGPFWDANETWLVLGVGILLTCFPAAHGVILGALYPPNHCGTPLSIPALCWQRSRKAGCWAVISLVLKIPGQPTPSQH